jgi:hypothetical protein
MSTGNKLTPTINSAREKTIFVTLACLVVGAVAVLSFLPPGGKHLLHTDGRFHRLGHLLAFSAVAYIAARTSQSSRVRMMIFIGSLALGAGIEFAEHLIDHGRIERKDIWIDAVGVVLGTLIATVTAPAAE